MTIVERTAEACLRIAVRRWPVDLRDELTAEWSAELAALRRRGGSGLGFALSLALAPGAPDEEGVPQDRWRWLRVPGATVRRGAGLVLAGGFGLGLFMAVQMLSGWLLRDVIGIDDFERYLLVATVSAGAAAMVTAGYCVVVGRRLGSGARPSWGGAGLAVGTVGALLAVWYVEGAGSWTESGVPASLAMVAVWALTTFTLTVVTTGWAHAGRPRRAWTSAAVGTPLAAAIAATAVLPEDGPGVQSALSVLPWTVLVLSYNWPATQTPPEPAKPAARTPPKPAQPATPTPLKPAQPAAQMPRTPAQTAVQARAQAPIWTRPALARQTALTALAVAASTLWAIGVITLQQVSEPTEGGENNTYWARELRWAAIVAVVLVVIVCARGARRSTHSAVLGGVAWLAVDIGLDRLDPVRGTVPLAVAAAGVATIGCYLAAGDRGTPRRPPLLLTAGIAAVLSAVSMLTESPTDTEPALSPGCAAAGCVLALVALSAALAAAPSVTATRWTVFGVSGGSAAVAPWALRYGYPQPTTARELLSLGLLAVLVVAIAALAWHRPSSAGQVLRYPVAATGALLMLPVILLPAVLVTMVVDIGGLATALAGSPPINAADEDVIMVLPAVLTGFAPGWLLIGLDPGAGRPAPAAGPVAGPAPVLTAAGTGWRNLPG